MIMLRINGSTVTKIGTYAVLSILKVGHFKNNTIIIKSSQVISVLPFHLHTKSNVSLCLLSVLTRIPTIIQSN